MTSTGARDWTRADRIASASHGLALKLGMTTDTDGTPSPLSVLCYGGHPGLPACKLRGAVASFKAARRLPFDLMTEPLTG
jgi:hypothetical protein